jgi:uridine monophosphate synthetase
MTNKNDVALQLFDIGAIKFGDFQLKTGEVSPIYVDLREIISFPKILKSVSELIWQQTHSLNFDLMCGVPYTALPITSYLSVIHDKPMVMRRKELKNYGTKKIIEGVFMKGQKCLIIEDIITTGASILETIEPLNQVDLQVKDIIVFVDREQGGVAKISEKGYNIQPILKLSEILILLEKNNRISSETTQKVKQFLQKHQH